jgi:hypothetical protein
MVTSIISRMSSITCRTCGSRSANAAAQISDAFFDNCLGNPYAPGHAPNVRDDEWVAIPHPVNLCLALFSAVLKTDRSRV